MSGVFFKFLIYFYLGRHETTLLVSHPSDADEEGNPHESSNILPKKREIPDLGPEFEKSSKPIFRTFFKVRSRNPGLGVFVAI